MRYFASDAVSFSLLVITTLWSLCPQHYLMLQVTADQH